jgi:hypothetical protein
MNKRCEYKDGLGYRCGSYAFNLYKEKIEQGDRCDRHYWQDQAMKAAAQEREACAKVCIQMANRCDDIRKAALEVAAENIIARGTT